MDLNSIMNNSAIVVVDELYDFIDGSMACHGAEECIKNSAELLKKTEGRHPIIFVCDHHPANHSSFTDQGGPWPPHCVQGTRGGEIADELQPYVKEELVFYKGTEPSQEQYSGFEGRNDAGKTLDEALKELEIKEIILIGIATEYCVRNTAEDLIKAGYRVFVKEDCLACVEPEDHKKAIAEMKAKGISFI